VQLSLSDLQAVHQAASRVDPNPLKVAGRLFGLSGAEQRAGVPAWGYAAMALGAGVLIGLWASQTEFLRERLSGR
jgi:hypothetical protein